MSTYKYDDNEPRDGDSTGTVGGEVMGSMKALKKHYKVRPVRVTNFRIESDDEGRTDSV